MEAAVHTLEATPDGVEPWLSSHVPPQIELTPWTPAELERWFRGGEPEGDDCERFLVWAARARGGLDLAIGEGLDALRQGDRLASLGFHLDDYAREMLDLSERTALELARLGRELRTRPILREALRSGRVRLRAAETVLAVAMGEAEAAWVERAARLTVRQLEDEVRRAGAEVGEGDEPWMRLRALLRPEERVVVEAGLDLAREVIPGASRMQALEALSQEFLAEYGQDPADDERWLGAFRTIGPGEESRRAALAADTERWAALPAGGEWPAPDARFDEAASAQEIDARLRHLARLRSRWDDLVAHCAQAVKRSAMHVRLGFASFRHYVMERLQLPPRAVEQRAAMEDRLSSSPALREARRQGLPYEKLRLLARLPEQDIGAWTPRAHAMTCITLRRRLEAERERQMRAVGKLSAPLPRRVAVLLAAAIQVVRARAGEILSTGRCLAVIAWHFLYTAIPGFKDTIIVPKWGSVTFRMPILNFTGMTMYHCHILEHEDIGMMGMWHIMSGM